MGGGKNQVIAESLFTEEGRSLLATRAHAFVDTCAQIHLKSAPLRRVEWIGRAILYKSEGGRWQVPADQCVDLLTQLIRELYDEWLWKELGALALLAWEGVCAETDDLRDVIADRAPDPSPEQADVDDASAGDPSRT
jgi:hypothetical protein